MEKLIQELKELGFDGKVVILRELSKVFEEVKTFDFSELWNCYQEGKMVFKGEFVVGLYSK